MLGFRSTVTRDGTVAALNTSKLARRAAVAAVLMVASACAPGTPTTPDPKDRVDLQVLVLSDGSEPVEAIRDRLVSEGVPHLVVDLTNPNRPTVTDDFLADTVATGPRAKFQAVVVPNETALPAIERSALDAYETRFAIREVLAYTWAHPEVGLNYAANPGYVGSLDGFDSQLTLAATSPGSAFQYLNGVVPFQDRNATVSETYGYLARPLSYPPGSSESFVPLLTATIPGTAEIGSLMGQQTVAGRERLVLTFNYNSSEDHFSLLGHGIIEWMTKGVHLGVNRNFLSVHIDDVFESDSRWSGDFNCTPGDDCPAGSNVSTPDIRMTRADVQQLRSWQAAQGIKLDMVFNAAGSVNTIQAEGTDPLTMELLAAKSEMRWVNHTYAHTYLGCIQDFSITPWQCETDASGIVWRPAPDIEAEISTNLTWAAANGLDVDSSMLVSGEHSGLASLPQMPVDNPNFVASLDAQGIVAVASDASREKNQRVLGTATRTVPRYPMNIFYNVGTAVEEVDEYNWIYTTVADGGSGICELYPEVTTCIEPLDPGASSFYDHIVPLEAQHVYENVSSNDPRPYYAHQSNLAEDRILYPVLDAVLARYSSDFAPNAPMVNPTFAEAYEALRLQAEWTDAQAAGVRGYLIGSEIHIENGAGSTAHIPLTTPDGPTSSHDYGGQESGWIPQPLGPIQVSSPWG